MEQFLRHHFFVWKKSRITTKLSTVAYINKRIDFRSLAPCSLFLDTSLLSEHRLSTWKLASCSMISRRVIFRTSPRQWTNRVAHVSEASRSAGKYRGGSFKVVCGRYGRIECACIKNSYRNVKNENAKKKRRDVCPKIWLLYKIWLLCLLHHCFSSRAELSISRMD